MCRYSLVESIPLNTTLSTPVNTYHVWTEMLDSATTNIDIACMYMDLSDGKNYPNAGGMQGYNIFQSIINAKSRGVTVRIVVV